ncbi:MAG: hypothetical protein MZW92_40380 [Comamonadaceae bacterium]|nr:hypothetical protein [Comamonadaceae bacterium]
MPSRGVAAVAVMPPLAVFGGLALAPRWRSAWADLRPMHHDEANQAVKFGELLETGDYRYDRHDHHGPTLYYLTLPAGLAARAAHAGVARRTDAARAVPAVFGAGLLLLFLPLVRGIRPARRRRGGAPRRRLAGADLLQPVLHPGIAPRLLLAGVPRRPRAVRGAPARVLGGLAAGAFAGLAYATKETSVIVLPAALAAVALARLTTPASRPDGGRRRPARDGRRSGSAALAAGRRGRRCVVAVVFYSSFFSTPGGPIESIRAFDTYLSRGVGSRPSHAAVRLLPEPARVLIVGRARVVRRHRHRARRRRARGRRPSPETGSGRDAVGLYTLVTCAAFSAIRYKTPWNLLPFYVGAVLMAGYGAAALLRGIALTRGSCAGCRGAARRRLTLWPCRIGAPTSATRPIPRNPYTSTRIRCRTCSDCRGAWPTSRHGTRTARACW